MRVGQYERQAERARARTIQGPPVEAPTVKALATPHSSNITWIIPLRFTSSYCQLAARTA